MSAILQAILEVLSALPSAISAISKIISVIKGQPAQVRSDAIQKGVKAMQSHVDKQK